MTTDPVVRYTAGLVLVLAFTASLAVALHGYWVSSTYVPPPVIVTVIASAVTGSLTLLGVHVGGSATTSGVVQGGKIAAEQTTTNGHTPPRTA